MHTNLSLAVVCFYAEVADASAYRAYTHATDGLSKPLGRAGCVLQHVCGHQWWISNYTTDVLKIS